MSKRVVGVYNSKEAAMLEIGKLKKLGHDENTIFILAKDPASVSAIVRDTGVQLEEVPENGELEPKSTGLFGRVFYALDFDTKHSGVAAALKSAGIMEDEVGIYVRKIEQGDLVVLATADVPRQPYTDDTDTADFSNEEQSMQYYENNEYIPTQVTMQDQTLNEHTEKLLDDVLNTSLEHIQPEEVQIYDEENEKEQGKSISVTKDEIYVEHIYFDSSTPPIESDDEELIRVPIIEERVKVINEKVVTGEIVVRKRRI
ncbi:general stress protein [Paenisporosarcina sp. TG-14]|uniref:general stress protein n=1 Tax=Paenisporosarcina sp. TG-14 TaxID=1231057 RepID=UPI0002E7CECF|nr:general stress protein [Paenisporosarcina sp. TG-14]